MAIEKTTFPSYTRNSDKKSYSSHEMVRAIDAASDSPKFFMQLILRVIAVLMLRILTKTTPLASYHLALILNSPIIFCLMKRPNQTSLSHPQKIF